MRAAPNPGPRRAAARERGQAVLLAVLLLAIGAGVLVYNLASPSQVEIDKDKVTAAALAQAKAALIGYAAGANTSAVCAPPNCPRPGDLPCPDMNDSGAAGGSCGNAAGSSQTLRIGRLPWKTLGLPDLRDGDGERLWYAVSNNFKYNTRTSCSAPGDAGCLNSDTRGTITVRSSDGTVIHNGSNPDPYTPSGVIAVVFAPGAVLPRQNTGTLQDRSCAGGTCTAAGVCNAPETSVAKCNPINYLDILTSVPEDNADFTDGSATDGFINGVVRDAGGNAIVNDRLITITYNDLMPALQRRVAQEVMSCLTQYAAVAQNRGRYPWPVPVGSYPLFTDQANNRFGRVPDNPLSATLLGVGGWPATTICQLSGDLSLCMTGSWPTNCGITQGGWWVNWKDLVFYGVASPYAPASPVWWGALPWPGGCGTCLAVDPPSPSYNKRVVVVVAGKRLSAAASPNGYPTGGGQPRTTTGNKQTAANYVEGTNDNVAGAQNTYEQQTISNEFSDFLLYQ